MEIMRGTAKIIALAACLAATLGGCGETSGLSEEQQVRNSLEAVNRMLANRKGPDDPATEGMEQMKAELERRLAEVTANQAEQK
ncbi:MAG: hypothetical protein H0T87_04365 [Gammaproteobacteria bacterium]|nr:hypothetical protein [Gammaproteobacteria bacterium]